ncbi:MAG: hypothetical protein P9L94_02920 [Candidatus Hinthialibacter antarcticus]|nr:hypothetical protein [Candidatus Hinthialibacter antarcticus]
MKRILTFLLLCVAAAPYAAAHLNSYSFSTITIDEESILYELRFPYVNTIELFAVDKNMDQVLTEEELEPAKQVMFYYFDNKIKILSQGRQLQMVLKDVVFNNEEDDAVIIVHFEFPGYQAPGPAIILCNVSEEVDPFHQNIGVIEKDGKRFLFTFTKASYLDISKITSDMEIKDPRKRKRPRAQIESATGEVKSASETVSAATDE